jgi:hypothetical protein
MDIKLGDKIWMHYGSNTLVVGHILDNSPKNDFIAVSPLPYGEYKKMPLMQRAGVPISWFEVKYCSYIDHISLEDLQKLDESLRPHIGLHPSIGANH